MCLYTRQCVLAVGGGAGMRVSFKEMKAELEMEELEGQRAASKTSASPASQFFSTCPL